MQSDSDCNKNLINQVNLKILENRSKIVSDNQKFKAKKAHGKIPVTPSLVSGDGS